MNGKLEAGYIIEYDPNISTSPSWKPEQKFNLEKPGIPIGSSTITGNFSSDEITSSITNQSACDAVAFLKQAHAVVLNGLQEQVGELQQKCSDLQVALAFELPYLDKEVQEQKTNLEKNVQEKEAECVELRMEILMKEEKETELRKELFIRDQTQARLMSLLAAKEQQLQQLTQSLHSAEEHIKFFDSDKVSIRDQAQSTIEIRHAVPTPPPKSAKDKTYSRPMNLYRRLLSMSSHSFNQENKLACTSPIESKRRASLSSVPHLPMIENKQQNPIVATALARPLVRQQLRVKKWNAMELSQKKLTVDQQTLQQCRAQQLHSEHSHHKM